MLLGALMRGASLVSRGGVVRGGMKVMGAGLLAAQALPLREDAIQARREGRSVPMALAGSAVKNFYPFVLTMGMSGVPKFAAQTLLFAPEVAGSLVPMVGGLVRERNTLIRQASRPFSHRFEHTEMSYAAQVRGLQSIGVSRGFLGAEAGAYAQRYARR